MHWSIRAAQREALHRSVAVLRAWARAHILPESIPLEDIVARARAYMAAYKVPRAVECVDALPKSGSGKVMWRRLQQRDGV
ncbi:MAG: hypothetical protein IT502_04045 [Rubrivivax sp.]|nr:hypothetical protein [Rubrivivax sp.]